MVRRGCIGIICFGLCLRWMALKLSNPFSLYRSLGANSELLLTWINPNEDPVPLQIGVDSGMSPKPIVLTPNISELRKSWGFTTDRLPQIVSQGLSIQFG